MKVLVKIAYVTSLLAYLGVQGMETDKKLPEDELSEACPKLPKRKSVRNLFKIHSAASVEVALPPKKEFFCNSARFLPNPDTQELANKVIHNLKGKKHFSQAEQTTVELCEKALRYTPADDTSIPEDERRRLCDVQQCLRLVLGAINKDERVRTENLHRSLQEEQQVCQKKMDILVERLTREKEKNIEKDELVQQLIVQHKENTKLASFALGLSSVVAFAGILSTGYALSKGKLSPQ